ncbi:hypothetical protein CW304_00770 [Bacillus sp. UFRGS-B20]|nr:hypothetical protein CW304_00770 [Bacillus sp. UFRGS-B20]
MTPVMFALDKIMHGSSDKINHRLCIGQEPIIKLFLSPFNSTEFETVREAISLQLLPHYP